MSFYLWSASVKFLISHLTLVAREPETLRCKLETRFATTQGAGARGRGVQFMRGAAPIPDMGYSMMGGCATLFWWSL
jgi:hypothetical protein